MTNTTKKYVFIIDTDHYAGNFERQMTAFCTGVVGECEVGDEYIPDFHDYAIIMGLKTDYFEDKLRLENDEGCWRPCSIYPTLNRFNNGRGFHYDANNPPEPGMAKYPAYESVGIFFAHEPTEEDITILKERAIAFAEQEGIKVLGFRIETITVSSEFRTL